MSFLKDNTAQDSEMAKGDCYVLCQGWMDEVLYWIGSGRCGFDDQAARQAFTDLECIPCSANPDCEDDVTENCKTTLLSSQVE